MRHTFASVGTILLLLIAAYVISEDQSLEEHILEPPYFDIWHHSSEAKDIPADVEHTHEAVTHTHDDYPEHTHADLTHGPHPKEHNRPPELHTPHNEYILHWHEETTHVHPDDLSHDSGRTHTHYRFGHSHRDGETVHEDHDATGEHTHPPANATDLGFFRCYNGYTHTHSESPPTVDAVLSISANKTNIETNESVSVSFTFDKSVSGFTSSDISVSQGSRSGFSGSGSSYSLTVTAPAIGTGNIVVSVSADVVNEGNNASSVTITYTQPTPPLVDVVLSISANKTNIETNESVSVSFTFDKSVSGFTSSDISVSQGSRSGFSGSGSSYSLTVTAPAIGTGNIVVSVSADVVNEGNNASSVTITYTQPTPDPALVAHSQELPEHQAHADTNTHTHTAVTHAHDDFTEHTHQGYSHSHPPEPEPEPVTTKTEPEPEPEPVTTETEPEPEPEPVTTKTEPEPEPEPVTTETEPEPEPEPVITETVPEPVTTEPETEPVITETVPEPVITEPETEPVVTEPKPEVHQQGAICISEIMFVGDLGLRPRRVQWIELFNTTSNRINLKGWVLKIRWHAEEPLSAEITLDRDFRIAPGSCRLVAAWRANRSEQQVLRDVPVLDPNHPVGSGWEHKQHRNDLFNPKGWHLQLIDGNEQFIDAAGNIDTHGNIVWRLPNCIVDDVRTSIVRRFDDGIARDGNTQKAWIRALHVKHPVVSYYSDPSDIATPGSAYTKNILPVTLSGFQAIQVGEQVEVLWTTASEINNAGFNILRSEQKTGKPYTRLNPKIIQGTGTSSEQHTYRFIDKTAKPGVIYYYQIEDISYDGKKQRLATVRLKGVRMSAVGRALSIWGEIKQD